MSHKATNWAVTVRGIPPHAKIVLWHLADRHNKETGRCDPSQTLLADDCEISRSGLNRQLTLLESAGFIKRIPRINSTTKRQESTAYILNFDVTEPQDVDGRVHEIDAEAVSTKEGEPCPSDDESRVHEMDTNLGREPGKNLARRRAVSSGEDFLVQAVAEGKPWAVSQVSAVRARGWISQGKITEDQCRKAGVL